MSENFPVYLESYTENITPISDEFRKHMFTRKPVYSAEIVRYCITITIHIHSVIPNTTRTLSITVLVIIA